MSTTGPIRDARQVRQLTDYYLHRGETRNHLLIVLSIHTALRVSDLLSLRWGDVYDFHAARPRASFSITESKTGKPKTVALHKTAVCAITRYAVERALTATPDTPLFLNEETGKSISRVQAYRLIRSAAETLSFQDRVSCHSLRKTFGYHAWKAGASPVILMDIYNHSSFAVTRRYLGIRQDDLNSVYHSLSFTP